MRSHFSFGSLRSDHIAGAFFIVFGIIVFALSGDLPFGSLSSPGAGMMPKLLLVLMIVFGIALLFGAAASQPFAGIEWSDGSHALMVVVIAGIAITLYQTLGFILTMTLLVFTLLIVVERKPVLNAAAYSIGLTMIAWWVFGKALKSPLETGILGF
ncbi:MAG: tripartite tricarboxylate transporter TctB family protein [Alphaproteobacteria bacterium]|nr:MAG: tripartite tricarboxylate transporter TctB family protein [Alphaproteobacteria bacterium]